jgi:DNA-binding response OmpR family regulator
MSAPQLLIYEKTPRWGPELKRQFVGSGVVSRAVRSIAEIGRLLAAGQDCLLVMDLRAGAGECLRFVARTQRTASPVRTLLIGSAQTRELEWVARELGADHFVEEQVGGSGLARLCRLYLEQCRAGGSAADRRSALPV